MRTVTAILIITLSMSSSLAVASPTGAPVALLTDPVWKAGPSGRDLKLFYPQRALGGGVSGFAVVSCTVGGGGELGGCAIWGEQPRGEGFGAALLRIAQYMRAAPTSASGAPTPGRTVRLGARFTAASIAGVDDQTVEVVTVQR